MRYCLCLFLAVPLVVPAQAPEPSFRTTTSEVLLDVVVRDKHGKIVRDLKPEEVQVFEDGAPQRVRHFEFFNGHPAPSETPTTGTPASQASPAPESNAATPPTLKELRDISMVSIVIANLDPRGRKLTQDALQDFIKTELQPNTYVGIFTLRLGGLANIQPYTNDGAKISAAVQWATGSALAGQLSAVNQSAQPDSGIGSADTSTDITGNPDAAATAPTNVAGSSTSGPASASTAAASGPAAAIALFMESSWVQEMHDVYVDSTRYLTPLRALIQAQAQIPGRKVVLLFSAGLPVHPDTVELLQNVISTANRANVSIYAVDTRGTTVKSDLDNARRLVGAAAGASMRQQLAKVNGGDQRVTPLETISNDIAEASIHADTNANMAQLAEGTGGALLPAMLDLREPLRRAMEDVQTHYELTYSPTNSTTDGGFRKIQVKVARKGVTVFARDGYYALPVLNGRQIYPFEMATLKALNTKPALHQFAFHAAALQFRPGSERSQLAFVFQTPTRGLAITKDGQWAKVHVCVTALIKNEQGVIVDKISKDIPYDMPLDKTAGLQQGVVSFTAPVLLPPGHYTLETAAVDRQSMKASVSRSALFVADDSGLSMSDIAVARRVDALQGRPNPSDPLQAHGGTVTPELSDVMPPDTAGKLELYAIAYPPAPVDAPVDASIEIWRDGKLVMQSPASAVPSDASGAASMLATLSTAKLSPGHYEARITFEYKGRTVSKSAPFTLVAGG